MTSHIDLPVLLSDLRRSNTAASGSKIAGPSSGDRAEPSTGLSPAGSVAGGGDDLEHATSPGVIGREAGERDPLLLRERMVSEEQIDGLRHRSKGKRSGKKVADFYSAQNEHIDSMLKPLSTLSAEGAQDAADNAFRVKFAVNLSFGCNIALAVLQLYAAISSGSLSLFVTMIDSVFDPLANLILWLAHRASDKAEERKWPARGSRFETIGNIVYSFLMWSVNLIIVVEAMKQFATRGGEGDDTNTFHLPSIIAVCVAFAVKFGLFVFCFAIRKWSSQVQVLWEDHRNDLLTNGFGILTATGGAKLVWWIDPMGATLIAVTIMAVWSFTMYEHFTHLAGIAAPVDFQNLVTYQAMTFNPDIAAIDTVKAYHSGPQYVVEIDIVLDPEMPLWRAHDIAQDLQDQIEMLPDVDRCFVHVDHEVEHKPEHRKKL